MEVNDMQKAYELSPLSNPSGDIRPGSIMGGRKRRYCLCLCTKPQTLIAEKVSAAKILNFYAGSQHRKNEDRIRANYDLNKKRFREVYRRIEIPETFNLTVSSKDSAFFAALKGSFGGFGKEVEANLKKKSITSIKIVDSFKETFQDADLKETLAQEILSEMHHNSAVNKKVKGQFLITEVHYAKSIDISFSESNFLGFKAKAEPNANLSELILKANASFEGSWQTNNVLRLSQSQNFLEKQKKLSEIKHIVYELKANFIDLSSQASFNQSLEEIEEQIGQLESETLTLPNRHALKENIDKIRSNVIEVRKTFGEIKYEQEIISLQASPREVIEPDQISVCGPIESVGDSKALSLLGFKGKAETDDKKRPLLKKQLAELKELFEQLYQNIKLQEDLKLNRIPFAVRCIYLH